MPRILANDLAQAMVKLSTAKGYIEAAESLMTTAVRLTDEAIGHLGGAPDED